MSVSYITLLDKIAAGLTTVELHLIIVNQQPGNIFRRRCEAQLKNLIYGEAKQQNNKKA